MAWIFPEFEFRWTCPEIDKGLENTKSGIEDELYGIVFELTTGWSEHDASEWVRDKLDNFMEHVGDSFEGVRSSNCEMREAADKQIERLGYEIESLQEEIRRLRAD
jgi:hypothetical protein